MKKRVQVNRGLLFIGLFMAVISSGQGFDDTQTNNLSDLKESEFLKLSKTGHKIQTTHILKGDMNDNNFTNIIFFQGKPNQGKIVEAENKIGKQEKDKGQNVFTTQFYKEMVFNVETECRDNAKNATIATNYKKSTHGRLNNLKEINKHENFSRISKSELLLLCLDNTSVTNKSTNLMNGQIIGLERDKQIEKEHTTLYSNNSDSSTILQALNLSNETFILSNEALKTNSQFNYKPTIIKLSFPPTKNFRIDNKLYLQGSKYQFYQTTNIKSFENNENIVKHICVIKPLIHNKTNLKYANKSLARIVHLEPRIMYDDNVVDSGRRKFDPCNPHPDKLRNMMNGVVAALVIALCVMAMTFLILFCIKVHSSLSHRFVNFLHLPLPEFGPNQESNAQEKPPNEQPSKCPESTAI